MEHGNAVVGSEDHYSLVSVGHHSIFVFSRLQSVAMNITEEFAVFFTIEPYSVGGSHPNVAVFLHVKTTYFMSFQRS